MIDYADPAKATHEFRTPQERWDGQQHRRLLMAVLVQAWHDLRHPEREQVVGEMCGCQVGIHCHNHCPNAVPYDMRTATAWIVEMSEEPWGFAWLCRKLGREPLASAEKLLGSLHSLSA